MKILLSDGSSDILSALRLVLEQQEGYDIAGESRDAINLLAQVARLCPDVIILDTEMSSLRPGGKFHLRSLTDLLETLKLLCPGARIIALSSHPDRQKDVLALVNAFVCKTDPPDVLLEQLNVFKTRNR